MAMFSKPLFIQTIKSNAKLFAIITGVLCLLIAIIMSVFVPNIMEDIKNANADAAINPLGDISTLIAFIANQFYGMMAIVFPMIYSILIGNKLIAVQVDKGSMAYNLSTPTTRTQITASGALYLAGSLAVMFSLIAVLGVSVAAIVQPDVLDYETFLMLTFGCFLLQFAISGIAFFSSCVFNNSSKSLALGAGLPLAFFAFKIVSGMSDKLEFLKYLSLNTLFDTNAIMDGSGYAVKLIVLAAMGVMLYIAGISAFKKKDLPL
ncbi:MAG TPA: ABC transporter permease subunit [Desulfosporosinus sp.]|nr:ABC transporter permease subunit [Desulfosporosinus sp.]